jgi:2,3-bisphosphoglycerate-independent phosphoglycerate mutase
VFVYCSAKLVDLALESGKIFEGDGFNYIKESFETGTLHLIGLLSDGGVHSRLDQVQVILCVRTFVSSLLISAKFMPLSFFLTQICLLVLTNYFVQLLLKGVSERGAKRIRLHVLTDGRDVLDGSSVAFVETLENDLAKLREKGIDAKIASGGGRMNVTMDRYEVLYINYPPF